MSWSLTSFHPKHSPMKRRESELAHAGFMKLGWSCNKLSRESGVSLKQVLLFKNHKKATLLTGARLALTISTALLFEGDHVTKT